MAATNGLIMAVTQKTSDLRAYVEPISFWMHMWYKLTEPSGHGRLFAMGPKRFFVQYYDGQSIAMAYDVACDYAEMHDGIVQKVQK